MIGRVVCSNKGRDKGYYLVVVNADADYVYVCDGKERPLSRPKRKNPKHLSYTEKKLPAECFETDKLLRKSLAIYKKERN